MNNEIEKEVQDAKLNLEELENVSGGADTLTEWTCPKCGKKLTGAFLKIQIISHQQGHTVFNPIEKVED